MPVCSKSGRAWWTSKLGIGADNFSVIAGFFTGGALAIRGGAKAARNSAIGCACLLAVIEGVGIGFQRMMAENTRLDVWMCLPAFQCLLIIVIVATTTSASRKWKDRFPSCCIILVPLCHSPQMASIPLYSFCPLPRKGSDCVFSLG